MKIGLLSDCHGNLEGLKRATDILNSAGAELLVCLGDVVGYGPDSPACIDYVKENFPIVLAGNHDHALVEKMSMALYQDYAIEAILYAKSQLDSNQVEYLSSLPLSYELKQDRFRIFLSHAHPVDYENWCYHPKDPYFELQGEGEDEIGIAFFGHTHQARFYVSSESGEQQVPRNFQPYSLKDQYGKTLVVNVGSCGQPRDSDTRTSSVLLDTRKEELTFLRGEYPIESVQIKMEKAGLSTFLIERLNYGR